jgi:alpha/beta superfamily hydrolase
MDSDYANLDTAARVQRLLEVCRERGGQFILVGSSLGAHVATTVSTQIATRGLYLLAPAFFMPGFEQYTPKPAQCPVTIVHGWNDEVVPVENSIRFAQRYRCNLHLIDDDHRLQAQVDQVCDLFDRFLRRIIACRLRWIRSVIYSTASCGGWGSSHAVDGIDGGLDRKVATSRSAQ